MASTYQPVPGRPLKLHLGGWDVKEGWTIVNVEDRPGVDVRGNVTDLSMFADQSVDEVYASHVYEHLSYMGELTQAQHWHRLAVSVHHRLGARDITCRHSHQAQTGDTCI